MVAVRELNSEETGWQNNYNYCFIEWNNMIWVEIYFDSSIIFLEGNKINVRLSTLTLHEA